MNNGYVICPKKWILDKKIKNELGLLLIISSLCNNKNYCWATNSYLAKLFDEDEATISRKIKKLEQNKYIIIEYERKGSKVVSRKLRLTKKSTAHCQKNQRSVDENVKDNNISINNIKHINDINMSCRALLDDTPEIYGRIINGFNKMGIEEISFHKNKKEFHFKNTKNTQKLVKNIIEKGYTENDIYDVIFLKYDQWIENNDKNAKDMSTYYRPSTILGDKFEEYLEEAKMKGIS